MSDSPHPSGRRLRECVAFHHIPFRPVPVKARHDGWTRERQRGFIDRLCLTGNVARSAKAVGMSAQSAYMLRKHAGAASFGQAWNRALASGRSYQMDVAIERSLFGERVPILRNGVRVGENLRFDHRLMIAVLNATHRGATEAALKTMRNFGESTSPSSTSASPPGFPGGDRGVGASEASVLSGGRTGRALTFGSPHLLPAPGNPAGGERRNPRRRAPLAGREREGEPA
jgi:hypothetical protein